MTFDEMQILEAHLSLLDGWRYSFDSGTWVVPLDGRYTFTVYVMGPYTTNPVDGNGTYVAQVENLNEHTYREYFTKLKPLINRIATIVAGEKSNDRR